MTKDIWIYIGFGGQLLFMLRFVVQWITSELRGKSIVPIYFWYFSIGGATILLLYAIHIEDPVFIVGQSGGLIIYIRNLMLIAKDKKKLKAQGG